MLRMKEMIRKLNTKVVAIFSPGLVSVTVANKITTAKQFLKLRAWNVHRLWKFDIKIVPRFIETTTE